jgi:DNA-directed RNA polymerase specialized sigma24 family protein
VSSPGSVTHWIKQLKGGKRAAVRPLWESYFQQLVARTRQKLLGMPRRAADEEDVALSAFDSFCRAAEQGRFPQLHDRHDLWQLLIVIADRKAHDLAKYEHRQRRGGGKVLDEGAVPAEDTNPGSSPLARAKSAEPTPALAAQVAEECRRLLALLGDEELQDVALRKMEGYSVEEIAAQTGWVPRTVQRRLRLIRRIWEQELRR